MNLTLTHVRLLVIDYKGCFRFYRATLGLKPGWGDEASGYADFQAGATKLALFGREAMAKAVGAEKWPAETPSQDRPDWGVRVAHFRDPDGNLIEINQNLPGRP